MAPTAGVVQAHAVVGRRGRCRAGPWCAASRLTAGAGGQAARAADRPAAAHRRGGGSSRDGAPPWGRAVPRRRFVRCGANRPGFPRVSYGVWRVSVGACRVRRVSRSGRCGHADPRRAGGPVCDVFLSLCRCDLAVSSSDQATARSQLPVRPPRSFRLSVPFGLLVLPSQRPVRPLRRSGLLSGSSGCRLLAGSARTVFRGPRPM
jgi:hypothetical protein